MLMRNSRNLSRRSIFHDKYPENFDELSLGEGKILWFKYENTPKEEYLLGYFEIAK